MQGLSRNPSRGNPDHHRRLPLAEAVALAEDRYHSSTLPSVLAAKPAPHGTGYSIDYAADYAADDRRIEPFLESWLQMHASITDARTPPKRAHATNSASHRG